MNNLPSPDEPVLTAFRDRQFTFRREPRYKCPLACIGYSHYENRKEMIWFANFSIHGMGFYSTKPFPVETPLQIEMVVSGIDKESVRATVVHSTQQANGDWLIGCIWEIPLTQEKLELYLCSPESVN